MTGEEFTMKRILCGLLCILMISTFVSVAGADSGNLPAINSLLQLGSTEKTEVSDVLDDYMPFNETFDEIENDIKIIVLQREAPKKEFTEKTEYPPFTGSGGFDDDFDGIDVGKSRLWLRGDLMARMPSYFIADSLEDATYLLIAETYYILDGSVSYVNYKNQEDTDLPEFKDADEMTDYFMLHPRTIESMTHYPKFGAFSIVSLYETATRRKTILDFHYTQSMRFAQNPDACDQWGNMSSLADILDALNNESGMDVGKAAETIESIDFVPDDKKSFWTACIDAKEYSSLNSSVTDYYWTMAEELKGLDPSAENRKNYDLIINDRNAVALSYFVNYCDYAGFNRTIDSIESSGDYIADPDYEWMETTLQETVDLFNQ